ncbi:TetR/AcrR family transcriptional regulator [Actinophytocola gossypii]|uniref:TetR/AcrR family transcriptional regulator n=1 Tax=Actinophytocola gossypii TaxID=2812003 RepID=A0ABT2J6N8_9PSEU|nr:TetR/AcrR family transcriptional regulator [Actinophytocola gossypii]MCT2583514.1 TetR/AcrR family transcriptional regulator [Actinophytocola gossypii]
MVRLTRAQQQERTRAAVLTSARAEFAARGYAEVKIDRIAERAELTRGAVYSNFPSKRALYLAVLVDLVEREDTGPAPAFSPEPLGAFARVWLERLPLAGDSPTAGHLQLRSLAGVLDDEPARAALGEVARLEAMLLGLALEAPGTRRVRLAELVLTLLTGAGHLADTAPGFGDPFDVTRACEQLAGIDLADGWDPPHLPLVAPAEACRADWAPPADLVDQVTGHPVRLDEDGVVAVLGARRLSAAEEAVRAARPGDRVTVGVVTGDPAETGRLVRLRIADLTRCLRRVFAPDALPRVRIVLDEDGLLAAAAGVADPGDDTETAVRVHGGSVVARAAGRGAAHAAATATTESSAGDRSG